MFPYSCNKRTTKRTTKITIICDHNCVPLGATLSKSSTNDAKIFMKLNKKCIKSGKYFLADSGYDSSNVRKYLIEKCCNPVIKQNKRNIKDESLITKFYEEEEMYKKRIRIEHLNSYIKHLKRLDTFYEKKIKSYMNFSWLSFIEKLVGTNY